MTRIHTGALLKLLLAFCLSLPAVSHSAPPAGAAYLESEGSKVALILCHGRGKHPTWKVVEPLRHAVHDKLGWHTLSLQMPADDKAWKDYANDFPEAYNSIRQAVDFLRREKNVTRIYLMGHSMGSRMASAYVAYNAEHNIDGLIVAGIRNNGPTPLDGNENLRRVTIPVLDIWGEGNSKDVWAANERNDMVSGRYQQIAISGANHKFEGGESEFVDAVVIWLQQQ